MARRSFSFGGVTGWISLLIAIVSWTACHHDSPPPVVASFDDHTRDRLETRDDYFAWARAGANRSVMKFVVLGIEGESQRAIHLDSNFFSLHDEWYWFRLLNGQWAPNALTIPVSGLSFETVSDIYAWAVEQPSLPLDLQFVEGTRLYSAEFYRLALQKPRVYGLGGLLYVPPKPATATTAARTEIWAFELEYSDSVNHQELVRYFDALQASLPADIASALHWVVRSPNQELLAQEMESQQLQFHDRILRYSELTVPGEVEVYNPGLVAGRLAYLGEDQPSDSRILISEYLLDDLPPAAGLISAVPQTPLSHVNLLAKNRGIPNVYLGGAMDSPTLDQLARAYAPVALFAQAPDQLSITALTETQFQTWRSLGVKQPAELAQVEVSGVPHTIALETLTPSQIAEHRPVIGGKSAGIVSLIAAAATVPDAPLAITIRPYVEHLAPLRSTIEAVLADQDFDHGRRARCLFLEGQKGYDKRFASAADAALRDNLIFRHPPGTLLGDLIVGGGVEGAIRAQSIAPATLATLTQALQQRFANFATSQGLRFRSSSNVEDIEGFNGAGLYDSNTGFLDAASQPTEKDRKRTVEHALKKTWASYWSCEATEERRLEGIDHLGGAMGVLVHARFDDAQELANGVLTLTLVESGRGQGPQLELALMEVNTQLGAVSVTNPDPGSNALPEVSRVRLAHESATPTIERVRPSSLANPGTVVLDDGALTTLLTQALATARLWLATENQRHPSSHASRVLVLDYEFRWMDAGWPSVLQAGSQTPRLVLKQARSLEPGLRSVSPEIAALPIPRDLLGRSRRVVRRRCAATGFELTVDELFTDPLAEPSLGFETKPFVVSATVTLTSDLSSLTRGTAVSLEHPDFASVAVSDESAPWQIAVVGAKQVQPNALRRLTFDQSGTYLLELGANTLSGSNATCSAELIHATPTDFLLSIINSASTE